jgi:hypothetical protein
MEDIPELGGRRAASNPVNPVLRKVEILLFQSFDALFREG